MITLNDYWGGHDKTNPLEISTELRKNAELTVELVNKLMKRASAAGVKFEINPRTKTYLSSGWRPAGYNATVKGAAVRSKHITGRAADIYDPEGDLDEWLMTPAGQAALKEIGLWIEHPAATRGWSHCQTVPPGSGNRVFYP